MYQNHPTDQSGRTIYVMAVMLSKRSETIFICIHAGPAEGTKLHARKNFCVFYPIELKLCTMIELFIPNNRIVFVFLF